MRNHYLLYCQRLIKILCFVGMVHLTFMESTFSAESIVCSSFSSEGARLKLRNETYDKTTSAFKAGETPSQITSQVLDINNDGKPDKVYILEKSYTASMGSELFVTFHGFKKTAELEKKLQEDVFLFTDEKNKKRMGKSGRGSGQSGK